MNSIWIARDKGGSLFAYERKPVRDERSDNWSPEDLNDFSYCEIENYWFPDLKWEDEPIELASRQDALDALDRVLGRWVHGGDADCIVSEYEEELDKMKEFDMEEKELTYEELKHYYHSTVGLWAIDRSPQEVTWEWIVLNAFQLGIEEKHSNSEKIGQNLKPFDLEAAKAGKPVCTRDGRKARIICFDRKGYNQFPIIALIMNGDKESDLYTYRPNGIWSNNGNESEKDLMMLPEKHEGWINLYNADTTFYYVDGWVYKTKEEAVQKAKEEVGKGQREKNEYIDTIKKAWEE